MSDDLISRSALKEAFENLASDDYNVPIWYQQTVFETIDNAPTVEQPTGEWIYLFTFLDSKVYECNHCKGRLSLDIPQRIDGFKYCNGCGAKMKNTNKESEETKMEMTVEQYRERMIEAFRNTGCEELIALVCLPNEDSFKAMESLLRNFWNKGGEEE